MKNKHIKLNSKLPHDKEIKIKKFEMALLSYKSRKRK